MTWGLQIPQSNLSGLSEVPSLDTLILQTQNFDNLETTANSVYTREECKTSLQS